MLKVYYLETKRVDGTDKVEGEEYIHGGILDIEGTLRKLIQDTASDEDTGLSALAIKVRKPTAVEVVEFENRYGDLSPEPGRNLWAEIDTLKVDVEALKLGSKAEIVRVNGV